MNDEQCEERIFIPNSNKPSVQNRLCSTMYFKIFDDFVRFDQPAQILKLLLNGYKTNIHSVWFHKFKHI